MDHVSAFDQAWVEGFKKALLAYVQQFCADAIKINSWTEDVDAYTSATGCDTCGWGADDPYTLTIWYHTEDDLKEYKTTETFGSILSNLCYYR